MGIELSEQVKSEEKGKELVLLPKEATPDITLVDKAYLTLADIFTRHYENALLEAGHYIINEFYDGNIALVKAGEPTKGHSLNQLIKRFQGREEGSPSRSWVFNAVNMVIDEEDVLLIFPKSNEQEIKEIRKEIEERGGERFI